MASIGTCWADSSWVETSWTANSWVGDDETSGIHLHRARVGRLSGILRSRFRLLGPTATALLLYASVFFIEIDTASRNLT